MPASPRLVLLAVAQPLVLLVAWLLGRLAHRLLRGTRARFTASALTLLSVLGMCLGFAVVGWFVAGQEVFSPLAIAAAFGADLLVLAICTSLRWHFSPEPGQSTIQQDALDGESEHLEFKSTARINLATGQRDERMETAVAKTVAAFCNTGGGTLLIGVSDEGELIGLGQDLQTLKQPDTDRFELWLRDMFHHRLGATAAQLPKVDFTTGIDDAPVCRVRCPRAERPVFLKPAKGQAPPELWVRVGNSSRALPMDSALEYASERWPAPVLATLRHQVRAAVTPSRVKTDH